jgi:hypothetical protein
LKENIYEMTESFNTGPQPPLKDTPDNFIILMTFMKNPVVLNIFHIFRETAATSGEKTTRRVICELEYGSRLGRLA